MEKEEEDPRVEELVQKMSLGSVNVVIFNEIANVPNRNDRHPVRSKVYSRVIMNEWLKKFSCSWRFVRLFHSTPSAILQGFFFIRFPDTN